MLGRVLLLVGLWWAACLGALALGTQWASPVVAFDANANGNDDLYLVSVRRPGLVVPLTRHPADDLDPTWSPDGRSLAFISNRDDPRLYTLYVLDLETLAVQRVWDGPQTALHPAWSSVDSRIAFIDNQGAAGVGSYDVYVTTLDGEREQLTQLGGTALNPDWSPDGEALVFEARPHYQVNSLHAYRFGEGTRVLAVPSDTISYPVWATDDTLLYTRLTDSGALLFRHDLQTHTIQAISPPYTANSVDTVDGHVVFNTTGRQLVYGSADAPHNWQWLRATGGNPSLRP